VRLICIVFTQRTISIFRIKRENFEMRLPPLSSIAQQVDRTIEQVAAGAVTTGFVREWSPPRPFRIPLSPQQKLKLRDVDVILIEDRCKGCNFCIEFCPRKVFEQGKKLNQIGIHPPRIKDSSLCVGCGVCEEICPDFAVFLVDKGSSLKNQKI
jgi:2-oxoglutarate ferredoxin oxidoreductase subunit delta